MSSTASIHIKKPEDREIWLPCGACNRITAHKILTFVAWHDETPGGDIQVWHDYMTVQCQGCKSICFCDDLRCTEDELEYDPSIGREVLKSTQNIYPSRIAGRAKLEESYLLPQRVCQIYQETHASLCNKLPILAGIGIRAILEAVCKEKSAVGDNLKNKIDSLSSMGFITEDGAKILHSLRFIGNKAAHEVKAHTETEINTAFDVIEYLLKGVYIIPKQAENLPKNI